MWSSWWDEKWQGKLKYSEKSCPTVTTNPTQLDLGSNSARRGGIPPNNRLSYFKAFKENVSSFRRENANVR
jgi:hypothetical protein